MELSNTINNSLNQIEIGNLKLGTDFSFAEETLQTFVDVKSLPSELQNQIIAEIATDKAYYSYYMEDKLKGKTWSKEGVNIVSTSLVISIPNNDKSLDCYIDTIYVDKVDQLLWSNVSVKINLSKYESELKKLILNALMDKFF